MLVILRGMQAAGLAVYVVTQSGIWCDRQRRVRTLGGSGRQVVYPLPVPFGLRLQSLLHRILR